jgi:integrase
MYSTLRALFNYAEAAEVIARSPCRHIRLPAAELVDRPTLDASQLAAVASGLRDHAAMVWLGAVLGLRWGEAAGLTVASVDFLRGDIVVTRQLGRDRELSDPKSAAGRRRLAAPAWLLDNLAALLAARGLTAADGEALVFVNNSGGPLNYTAWRRIRWVPACEAAGLAGLRFHDLRSVAASAMVATGVDVKTAQTRLGHASASLTLEIYARASAAADRRAADLVGEHFRPRDRRGMDG